MSTFAKDGAASATQWTRRGSRISGTLGSFCESLGLPRPQALEQIEAEARLGPVGSFQHLGLGNRQRLCGGP